MSAPATMCVRPCSSRRERCTAPTDRSTCARSARSSLSRAWPPPAPAALYGPCRAAAAIVGRADLKLGDRVEPVLEALRAASPNRFRGIRHTVTWDPHPEIESREKEKVLATAEYQAGARGAGADGAVARHRGMLSATAGARGLRQSRARSDDHPEPSRRVDADRPLRQPRRRGARHLAARHCRAGAVPQRQPQARRHRHAADGLRLAHADDSRSARRNWRRRWPR